MPYINSFKFGEIIVDDKKYHQVLIIGKKVEERDCDKLRDLFSTTHKTGAWEIVKLFKDNTEIIIIGTGTEGVMDVSQELLDQANKKKIKVMADLTPIAIEKFNSLIKKGKRVNALIHTTC